ncbi:MAG: hypothetical protein EUB_02615 [Eubacterium sp.]|uniref:hypothetical protein n=1 Tax=Eubacterium sp. TaxID=142586 RepID=UPI00304D87E4
MGTLEEMAENMIKLAEAVNKMADGVIELQQKIEEGSDVVWKRKDLQEYLGGSYEMTRYLLDQPDFPKYYAGSTKQPLFVKKDVIDYIAQKAKEGVMEMPAKAATPRLLEKGQKSALYT